MNHNAHLGAVAGETLGLTEQEFIAKYIDPAISTAMAESAVTGEHPIEVFNRWLRECAK